MSNNIQKKLYDYEVSPPAEAWRNIAAALDEAAEDEKIAKIFNAAEMPPPALIWNKITSELDIANADKRVSTKINKVEVAPPAGIWEKIIAKLYENETKVIDIATTSLSRTFNWRKLAVAASIIAIAAVSSILLLQKGGQQQNAGVAEINDPKADIKLPQTKNIPADQAEPEKNEPLAKTEKDLPVKDEVKKNKQTVNIHPSVNENRIFASLDISDNSLSSSRTGIEEKVHNNISNVSSATPTPVANENRYYLLLDENGNTVKVSKKLNSMQCVLQTNPDIPVEKNTANSDCIETVKQWHDVMAKSAAINSPLELLEVLNKTL